MKKIRQIIIAGLFGLACLAPERAIASEGTGTNPIVSDSAFGINVTEILQDRSRAVPSGSEAAVIEAGRQVRHTIKTFEKLISRTEPVSWDDASAAAPVVSYQTYMQNRGWQNEVSNGAIGGIIGQELQMESIRIQLKNLPYAGSISYRTLAQGAGWSPFVSNGTLSGTEGVGGRLEAIEMKLTGEMALQYDVYYRAYAQRFGWLDWSLNGETAGTEGFGYRLEAVEVLLVKKGATVAGATENRFVKRTEPLLSYASYLHNEGWQNPVSNAEFSGTAGQTKQLEGLTVQLSSQPYSGSITYRTDVQDYGWLDWVKDGGQAGMPGTGKGLEAIEIALTDEMALQYDVYYQVYVQNIGWLDWAMNGAVAGTEDYGYALDGLQIQLVPKGGAAPGSLATPFMKKIPEKAAEPEVAETPESPETAAAPALPELPAVPSGPDWNVRDGYFKTDYGTQYYVGSSYIIVSLSYQTVWAYIGNDEIVEAPVITGRPSMPTPRGLFYIQPSKESPSVLIGEDYKSPVQYWIPFLGNSYGLHDSPWQTSGYGGELYQTLGSHGCVNTPYYAVETLYNTFPIGTPVVVY